MKVVMIDDHALFREGLRYLLRSMTDNLEYVETEKLKRLPDLSPEHPEVDLILLDLNIGGTDGLVAVGDLQTLWQETPIVIVTASGRTARGYRTHDGRWRRELHSQNGQQRRHGQRLGARRARRKLCTRPE